jgi:hypothetical protein
MCDIIIYKMHENCMQIMYKNFDSFTSNQKF